MLSTGMTSSSGGVIWRRHTNPPGACIQHWASVAADYPGFEHIIVRGSCRQCFKHHGQGDSLRYTRAVEFKTVSMPVIQRPEFAEAGAFYGNAAASEVDNPVPPDRGTLKGALGTAWIINISV